MKAMATDSSFVMMKHRPHHFIEQMDVHGWNWLSVGAAVGLCFGIFSPIAGSILTIVAWVSGPRWHGFLIHRDATALFALTIPMLILGAHCLDLLDRKDVKSKLKSAARPAHSKVQTAKSSARGKL
jgi:hypothetical protein